MNGIYLKNTFAVISVHFVLVFLTSASCFATEGWGKEVKALEWEPGQMLMQDSTPDTVTANNGGSQPNTLDDCFRIARSQSLALKIAGNQVRANEIDRNTARYSFLPEISYNVEHYLSVGKNIDPVTNAFVFDNFSGGYTSVGAELQLFSGLRRLNTVKQAVSSVEASEYGRQNAELQLLSGIIMSYSRLLLDREQLQVQRSNIQSTARQLVVVNEKIRLGRLAKYEFYAFNARLNTEQADLVTLQNDSMAASQSLKQLLNIPFSQPFEIADIDAGSLAGISAADISSTDFIEEVLKKHPAIRQAEMQQQAALFGQKIARSIFFPTLSVGGNLASNYNVNERNNDGGKVPLHTQLNNNLGQNLNISLRIPIFSQMDNTNRVRKEKINVSNSEIALQQARNDITTSTLQLINDFKAARQKYKATAAAWEQNKLSYNLYEEKYNLGQISSVELLSARDILNDSSSKYLQAKLQLFFQFQVLELLRHF